jgi:hypothetical protein
MNRLSWPALAKVILCNHSLSIMLAVKTHVLGPGWLSFTHLSPVYASSFRLVLPTRRYTVSNTTKKKASGSDAQKPPLSQTSQSTSTSPRRSTSSKAPVFNASGVIDKTTVYPGHAPHSFKNTGHKQPQAQPKDKSMEEQVAEIEQLRNVPYFHPTSDIWGMPLQTLGLSFFFL